MIEAIGERLGVADIPTKLGADILIRTILPGLIVFIVFFEPIIYPLICGFWKNLETFGDELLAWILFGFTIGVVLMICDLYIYQFLEGVRFWPKPLWKWKYRRVQRYFQKLDKELENLIRQKNEHSANLSITELEEISLRIKKLSDKTREFPPDYSKENFTKRYPVYPTRFGNVICEYEDYSLNRYGIHMMVFWNHLNQLLPKEIKEELKLKGAISDLCVYLCFASLLYIFIGLPVFFLQKDSWIFVWNYLIPVKSLFRLSLSILVFKCLYELSITQHKSYGRIVKSTFDLYRKQLANRLVSHQLNF